MVCDLAGTVGLACDLESTSLLGAEEFDLVEFISLLIIVVPSEG